MPFFLYKALGIIVGCLVLATYRILSPLHVAISMFCVADYGFGLVIRRSGKIRLGKVKLRGAVFFFCDGGTISLADGVFVNRGCSMTAMESISVGANTIIGEGVKIYDHNHLVSDDGHVDKKGFTTSPVTIGKNCWIGSNVVILKGVSVCDNVTIGAGSVISKSIEDPGAYVSDSKLRKIS